MTTVTRATIKLGVQKDFRMRLLDYKVLQVIIVHRTWRRKARLRKQTKD